LLAGAVAGGAAGWALGSIMVRGGQAQVPAAATPAVDFYLRSRDGTRIAATYRPGKAANSPAVLLLHGVRASRQANAANAAWLSEQGYASLTIDFRGHGGSDLRIRTFGLEEAEDARAAFRWLKRRQENAPVGIIGISLGGAASLLGGDGPVPADALILQAVYPDIRHAIRNRIATVAGSAPAFLLEPLLSFQSLPRFGVAPSRLSPLNALRRFPGPVLVIGGAEDRYTPPAETKAMFEAAGGKKSMWLVPGKDHTEACDLRDEEYRARILAFFTYALGRP
jgi:pimeloyl-ACP methyl ester carboxylesterase